MRSVTYNRTFITCLSCNTETRNPPTLGSGFRYNYISVRVGCNDTEVRLGIDPVRMRLWLCILTLGLGSEVRVRYSKVKLRIILSEVDV